MRGDGEMGKKIMRNAQKKRHSTERRCNCLLAQDVKGALVAGRGRIKGRRRSSVEDMCRKLELFFGGGREKFDLSLFLSYPHPIPPSQSINPGAPSVVVPRQAQTQLNPIHESCFSHNTMPTPASQDPTPHIHNPESI